MTTAPGRAQPASQVPVVPMLLAVALGGLVLLFRDSLGLMVGNWWSWKGSYGLLVPFVVIALLCLQPQSTGAGLKAPPGSGAWTGLLLLLAGAGLLVLGELAALYTLSQLGFVVALWGLLLSAAGFHYLHLLWLPLLYLLLMVPLPQFLANNLAASLQLMAVLPGAGLIRMAGFAVVLEGNVLDVGVYRIPVVEACSSVLMFLPLLSVALPAAVLYRGRWWWRLLLLSSALWIPLLAGTVRVAATGLLARYLGAAAAETFLYATGGVPLYLACAGLLLLLIWWLGRRTGSSVAANWGLSWPATGSPAQLLWRMPASPPLWSALFLIAALLLASLLVSRPELQVPERQRFAFFPRQLGDWEGRRAEVDPVALASLKLADHLSLAWQRPADPLPVSLWVTWYDRQVYGASVHSPMACLPGAGWRVEMLESHSIPPHRPGAEALRINRAVIALGEQRQLVYYWFAQRGRVLRSEYLLKWFIFQDSLLMERSDGGLVRLTTPLPDLAATAEADARLTDLTQLLRPVLEPYVPGADVPMRSQILNNP
ncbi:MAG: EpsI family protein [Gammaproteobacteria bacterium]|nr:EpsI family protein [Gammaproteobacteria bacterium]